MLHSAENNDIPMAFRGTTAKILMLHGHTESGEIFRAKTRKLEAYLSAAFPPLPSLNAHPEYPGGVELYYPTGPLRLLPADEYTVSMTNIRERSDIQAWAWGNGDFRKPEKIEGLSQSVANMLDFMHQYGPFVGVIGFSCGATLTAILASLLEGGRSVKEFRSPEHLSHPPLKFAVCYSGFMLSHPNYKPCYYPKIRTPTIHVIGKYDPITEEPQVLTLARRCKNSAIIYHPGSHYIPTSADFLNKVMDFINASMGVGKSVKDEDSDWVDI